MTAADVDDVHAYQSREDVCRYLPFTPRTRDEVAAKLPERFASRPLAEQDDCWQIAIDLDGRVIGDVFLFLRSVEHAGGEVGWSLHPDFEGRGYVTEAAAALVTLAFGGVGLHRLIARLDARNERSAALCRRLGMRHEATLLEDVWFRGAWRDTACFALLDREWANGGGRRA
jgi:RimJ/RimL family protein N-acetyltransferase